MLNCTVTTNSRAALKSGGRFILDSVSEFTVIAALVTIFGLKQSHYWQRPDHNCKFESVVMNIRLPSWVVRHWSEGRLSESSGRHNRVIS